MTIKEMQARFTGECILVADPQTNEALEVYLCFQLFSFCSGNPWFFWCGRSVNYKGFASFAPFRGYFTLFHPDALALSLCVRFTRFLPFQR